MLAEECSAAHLDSPKKESERPTLDLEEAKRVLAAMTLTAVKGLFKSCFCRYFEVSILCSQVCILPCCKRLRELKSEKK